MSVLLRMLPLMAINRSRFGLPLFKFKKLNRRKLYERFPFTLRIKLKPLSVRGQVSRLLEAGSWNNSNKMETKHHPKEKGHAATWPNYLNLLVGGRGIEPPTPAV